MILNKIEEKELLRYINIFPFISKIKNKTFLITGSNGMTGTGIIKWLLFENQIHQTQTKIIASTRSPNNIPNYIDNNDNIQFCMFGNEKEEIGNQKIDYIIHAASPTERQFFISYPVETLKTILEGTIKMLDLANEKKCESFIYLSSVEIYGLPDTVEPIKEDYVGAINSLNIRNCYPLGKKSAELLCVSYHNEYNVNTKIIRLSSIQGLFQPYNEQRVFNEILRCILENNDLILKSDGSSKKSIIYSLDAISAIFTVLFNGKNGEVYNATNPSTFMSVKDLANKLFTKYNSTIKIRFDETNENKTGYLPHLSFTQNIEKIKKLGWGVNTDLEKIYQIDIDRWKK